MPEIAYAISHRWQRTGNRCSLTTVFPALIWKTIMKSINERYTTGTGQVLRVHSKKDCVGPHCPIHNPSDHHMKDWPTHWRDDLGILERICEHGVGHPDPDDVHADPVHGCDGCCCKKEQ